MRPFRFFHHYAHFLQVAVSAQSKEQHLKWSGVCGARMRHLVTSLEELYEYGITLRPFPAYVRARAGPTPLPARARGWVASHFAWPPLVREFEEPMPPAMPYRTCFYVGLAVHEEFLPESRVIDLSGPVRSFCKRRIASLPDREAGMDLSVKVRRSLPRGRGVCAGQCSGR